MLTLIEVRYYLSVLVHIQIVSQPLAMNGKLVVFTTILYFWNDIHSLTTHKQ